MLPSEALEFAAASDGVTPIGAAPPGRRPDTSRARALGPPGSLPDPLARATLITSRGPRSRTRYAPVTATGATETGARTGAGPCCGTCAAREVTAAMAAVTS